MLSVMDMGLDMNANFNPEAKNKQKIGLWCVFVVNQSLRMIV